MTSSASSWGAKAAAAVIVISGVWTGAATAADGVFDEVKGGVQAHDVGLGGHHKENGYDINGELLFVSPDFLKFAYAPRPHLGLSINTSGNTDQIYGGLTWTVYGKQGIFSSDNNFFVNLSLGGAVNDGGDLQGNDSRLAQRSGLAHVSFRRRPRRRLLDHGKDQRLALSGSYLRRRPDLA